ncbi:MULTISPECIES: helix-turn-helix domain-containing protein [Clostridium]|uniref:XRE family transcriptional regulator n=1 Tax=Clostridium manihotivorum TaxID=2320868 RepID=A0A3R5UBN0_9CLOT|nr:MULTISPECIES: helix-turn-helix transcriptional regulator [Clostridium]QAA34933.1 XRE family transcriptional regulator [Clostridium manihotivorum]
MLLEEALAIVLKEYRTEKNLSQEELADKCDLDRTYISLLERGKRKPTLSVIFNICNSLKVKPSVFIAKIEILLKDKI